MTNGEHNQTLGLVLSANVTSSILRARKSDAQNLPKPKRLVRQRTLKERFSLTRLSLCS